MNAPFGRSTTLLRVIEEAARLSARKGAKRHLYVLSCYFDIPAVIEFAKLVAGCLREAKGTATALTVAVDAGEWIKDRRTVRKITRMLAKGTGIPGEQIKFVPVHVRRRLLHAKAYAAIRPGGADVTKRGFLVVTSGNATQRGLGLDTHSNVELASVATDESALIAFEQLLSELLEHEVSEKTALRQDRYLRALALFSSGVFYHHWPGSLGAEVRFKMTLTTSGKAARKKDARLFRGYEPDANTLSRDELGIEGVFDAHPKPFPAAFWRTFAVNTLLGYWVPATVASVVDKRLSEGIEPHLEDLRALTSPIQLARVGRRVAERVRDFSTKGWIEESTTAVDAWRTRVLRFRRNKGLIKLRIHPYQRVPDMLEAASRASVLDMEAVLSTQLGQKKALAGTKSIVSRFLSSDMSRLELKQELEELANRARRVLRKHTRK